MTVADVGSADDLDWHWESVSVPSGPLVIMGPLFQAR